MNKLDKIFSNLTLKWVDDNTINILESNAYREFIQLFPKLDKIFQDSLNKDKSEFERTLRHTFRLLIIYFQLKSGEFKHKSLNLRSIEKIRDKIKQIDKINPLFLPLILILHDIGRPFNRKLHTYESAKIIQERDLLSEFNLTEKEKVLIIKVIEYHLLIGTIYTGESTYYAVKSLLNDEEFIKYLEDKDFITQFVLLSSTFTILDPFGYFYAQIFDHYIEKYSEIEQTLARFLLFWPDMGVIQKELKRKCLERLDWRLACSLRIFQTINTKPQLTYNFFIKKIKDSVEKYQNEQMDEKNWESFKLTYLSEIYKTQLKYALPVLMVLASGEFKRFFQPKEVNSDLIHFWICLNQKIKEETEKSELKDEIWNVIFDGLPRWAVFKDSYSQFLEKERIKSIIKNATVKFDKIRKENWLLLDFKLNKI